MKLKQFLRRIFEIYKPFRRAMMGVFAFIAASQALNLFAPYLQGRVIDELFNRKPINQIYLLIGATLVISLIRIGLIYWREKYELHKVDFVIPQHMNHMTITSLCGYSIGQHINENSGLKQSKITKGQHSLNALAGTMLYQIIPMVVEILFLAAITLYFSRVIGLILFCGVFLYMAFAFYINHLFKDDIKNLEEMDNKRSKFQSEILRNIELVLVNAGEQRATKEYDESLSKVHDVARELWLRFVRLVIIGNLIPAFTRFLIFAVGALLVYQNKFTAGQLVMFLAWSGQAISQLSNIGYFHRQIMQMSASVKKYFEMLDIELDVKVLPNPVYPDRFQGKIEFKNVTFKYKRRDVVDDEGEDGEEAPHLKTEVIPALKGISFAIEAGETVAFVGESGAGKSTIIHALIRANDPEEGRIIIDGNDIRTLDLKQLREAIGIVSQQVSLFDHTLRYNITYGLNGRAAEMTDAELDKIAEMSCINRFFSRLEKGYDTIIGERGIKLSGGECQRVGIARALIKNPDILIFDEATSSLDSENEALIRKSIEKASKGRTTIIIAHRFSTIRNVDKIIVLNKGEVAGIGAHNELVQDCEPYQRLIKNQILSF